MKNEIMIKNLNMFYGNKQSLKDVNLEIGKGVFGLLGRNGAGKSTLIKALVTLRPIKSGDIKISGVDIAQASEIRKMIRYMPQSFNIYPNMKVSEVLDYLASMSNMNGTHKKAAVRKSLDTVNLWDHKDKKVKHLSEDMKKRLGIAQAIVHSPKVVIIDEPTTGLDLEEKIELRNLLADIAKERIVILSTDKAEDIEGICERVAVLNGGKIIFNDTVKNLTNRASNCTYTASIPTPRYQEYKDKYIITKFHDNGEEVTIRLVSSGKPEDIFKLCDPVMEDGYVSLIHDIGGHKNV